MIRIFNKQLVAVESGSVYVADIYCDSSDTKPTTELANGSTLTEVDTGKRYLFNEATTSWVEVSGGGGGGSANSKEMYTGTMSFVLLAIDKGLCESIIAHYGDWETGRQKFYSDLADGNASAIITITLDGVTARLPFIPIEYDDVPDAYYIAASLSFFSRNPATLNNAGSLRLGLYGEQAVDYVELKEFVVARNGSIQDVTDFAPFMTCTLEVFWHNMPSAYDVDEDYSQS